MDSIIEIDLEYDDRIVVYPPGQTMTKDCNAETVLVEVYEPCPVTGPTEIDLFLTKSQMDELIDALQKARGAMHE